MSKRYKLKYHIALDLGDKYKDYPDLPEFNSKQDATDFWARLSKSKFIFYNEPIVIIRKEISITEIETFQPNN